MKYRITVLSLFVGIAIASFCIGRGQQAMKSQVPSDVKILDQDKIGKLPAEVAELQKKLAALMQKYKTHSHQLRNLEAAQLPGSMECDQTVVQWTPADN